MFFFQYIWNMVPRSMYFFTAFMSKLPAAQHFDSQKDLCCFKTAVAKLSFPSDSVAFCKRWVIPATNTVGVAPIATSGKCIDLDSANHLLHQLTWLFGGCWLKGYSPHVSRQCFVALQCGYSILRPRNVLSSSAPCKSIFKAKQQGTGEVQTWLACDVALPIRCIPSNPHLFLRSLLAGPASLFG